MNNIQITNIVCSNYRAINLPIEREIHSQYRGNYCRIAKNHFTVFCTRNIKKIFLRKTISKDFSRFLTWVLGRPVEVQAKICVISWFKYLRFDQQNKNYQVEIKQLIRKIWDIGGKPKFISANEGEDLGFVQTNLENFMSGPYFQSTISGVQFKTNNEKIHVRIQFASQRNCYSIGLIVSHFGEISSQIVKLVRDEY